MQQEPYFFSGSTEASRLQYPNAYAMQPTLNPWPNNYNPNVAGSPGIFNSDASSLHYGQQSQLITPVSTAMYGTTSTYSWAHTVPSLMPWVPRAEVTVPDPVRRFSAPIPPDPCTSQTATSWELLNNYGANKAPNPNLHLKRKVDLDGLECTPPKLCITEEKMAARFREMHISNQYNIPVAGGKNLASVDESVNCKPVDTQSITNLQQLEVMLQDPNSSAKQLVLAPEIKKLVEPEKILSTFLNKIERPSMAVVLYQPNKLRVEEKDKQKEESQSSAMPDMENNNNVMAEQLNPICQQYLLPHVHKDDQAQVMSEDCMDI